MQNITELTTGQTFIDNNGYHPSVIKNKIRRVITQAEIDANNIGALKWNGTDFVIDQAVIDADLQIQLDNVYADKLTEIKTSRDNLLENGKLITSTIANFEIDCRYRPINDALNVKGLIDGMTALNIPTVTYMGTTTEKTISLANLQSIYLEMITQINGIFDHKIKKDVAIKAIYNDSVKTVQQKMTEIQAITW